MSRTFSGSRRGAAAAAVVLASVIGVASLAFACTTFKGTFTVAQGTTSKTNTGNNTGMGFCGGAAGETISLSRTGTGITVSGGPSTGSCASRLSNSDDVGNYTIKRSTAGDCMNGTAIGSSFTIGDAGTFSRSITANSFNTTDIKVCIASEGNAQGNEMSIIVT